MSLLGIDIGTTGCKAVAFSADGWCLGEAYREYPPPRTDAGHMELDARKVWGMICGAVREVAAQTAHDPVTALSTSSLGEALVPVSRDRRILGTSILCTDFRGREYVDFLLETMSREEFYEINPNLPGTHYSLPKLMWLRDYLPDLYGAAHRFLLWGDLVGFMLGCEPVTADSLANRTLLFDLRRNDWSERLLAWSRIDPSKLAPVRPGGTVAGFAGENDLGIPKGAAVVVGGHDQCCNALGAGAIAAGRAVCGIGTFECITPVFDSVPPLHKMLASGLNVEHHVLPGLYVSFLYNQSGMLVKWFADTFAAAECERHTSRELYDLLAREMPADVTPLIVLPCFEGTGTPHFLASTSGVIAGLKTGTRRGEILKAIMECTTLYFVDSIVTLKEMGIDTSEFVATGGGARSDQWLQIKADVLGVPFVRPRVTEASALGAAMLAGVATGVFRDAAEACRVFVHRDRAFEPVDARHRQYREKHERFRDLFRTFCL